MLRKRSIPASSTSDTKAIAGEKYTHWRRILVRLAQRQLTHSRSMGGLHPGVSSVHLWRRQWPTAFLLGKARRSRPPRWHRLCRVARKRAPTPTGSHGWSRSACGRGALAPLRTLRLCGESLSRRNRVRPRHRVDQKEPGNAGDTSHANSTSDSNHIILRPPPQVPFPNRLCRLDSRTGCKPQRNGSMNPRNAARNRSGWSAYTQCPALGMARSRASGNRRRMLGKDSAPI